MYKTLFTLLSIILLSASANALLSGNVYIEASKIVNGGQVIGLPVVEIEIAKTPLLIDLEFRNNFSSKRGALGTIPNHLSSVSKLHFGYIAPSGIWTSFSLNTEFVYAENDYGLKEGLNFSNDFRIGYSFNY